MEPTRYGSCMMSSVRRTATQWLLLCALFLGVVGMHHVAMSDGMAPTHAVMSGTTGQAPASEQPDSPPAHDLPHLCLAVLCAIGSLLLLAWLLARVVRAVADRARAMPAWSRATDHPPPIGGRTLLNSICVLRL